MKRDGIDDGSQRNEQDVGDGAQSQPKLKLFEKKDDSSKQQKLDMHLMGSKVAQVLDARNRDDDEEEKEEQFDYGFGQSKQKHERIEKKASASKELFNFGGF